LRVVHIINSLAVGGAERLLLELHAGLLRKGIESRLLTLAPGPLDGEADTVCMHRRNIYSPSTTLALARRLTVEAKRGADLFHVHLFPSLLHFALASRLARVRLPAVYTEHHVTNRRRGSLPGRVLDAMSYGRYDRVVCVSEAARRSLVECRPSVADRAVVIRNGIDLSRFAPEEPSRRKKGPPVVVSVGRLREGKNLSMALRAVSMLEDLRPVYRIVGEGPMRSALEALAAELGLEGRAEFLGARDDVPKVLAGADVLLHPSLSEGFGLVVLEAMAAGLPVVCTDLPALREVVGGDGGAALLCPPDAGEYATALGRVLESPGLREEMAGAGRSRARRFDMSDRVEDHAVLYGGVAAG